MALAADAERERTVGALRRAYLEGRLGAEEFADRAGRALEARTTGELRALVRDLPSLGDVLGGVRDLAVRLVLVAAVSVVWVIASIVLLMAFLVALLPGWMSAEDSLVFPLAWLLATWGLWRAARR